MWVNEWNAFYCFEWKTQMWTRKRERKWSIGIRWARKEIYECWKTRSESKIERIHQAREFIAMVNRGMYIICNVAPWCIFRKWYSVYLTPFAPPLISLFKEVALVPLQLRQKHNQNNCWNTFLHLFDFVAVCKKSLSVCVCRVHAHKYPFTQRALFCVLVWLLLFFPFSIFLSSFCSELFGILFIWSNQVFVNVRKTKSQSQSDGQSMFECNCVGFDKDTKTRCCSGH